VAKGLFETDKEGKISGINPALKKKIGPSFRGWTQADETIASQIVASLDTGERTIWERWMAKLASHQRTQIRLLLTGIYKEFTMEDAVKVARAFINVQEDDDDSQKKALALQSGIITETDIVADARALAGKVWARIETEADDAQKVLDEFHQNAEQTRQSLHEKINAMRTDTKTRRQARRGGDK
jgi:translation initiation factor 2B subunit (eIF-2B alpha/beta/delta family)